MNAYPRHTHPPHLGPMHKARATSAFTLVEILVVIGIIGILTALLVPAAMRALTTAKEAAIRTEIGVFEQALEKYNLDMGDYPPDFSDWAAVERHFRKAYTNINNNELRIVAQFTHLNASQQRCGGSGTVDPRAAAAFDHYPHAIDRAEALVFCLGGLSKDTEFPFTGPGGPLVLRSGATSPYDASGPGPSDSDYLLYQYNSERETGYFDFDSKGISVALFATGPNPLGLAAGYTPYAYSNDEEDNVAGNGFNGSNDLDFVLQSDPFPTYSEGNSERPLVYFSSRSYNAAFGIGYGATPPVWNVATTNFGDSLHHSLNVYLPAGGSNSIEETGIARPYVTNNVDTTPPATIQSFAVAGTVLQFAGDGKFQVISAGLDHNFGGTAVAGTGAAATGISVYPSGEAYNPITAYTPAGQFSTVSSVNKYQDDLILETQHGAAKIYSANPQLDNVTSFTTRTLESDLP